MSRRTFARTAAGAAAALGATMWTPLSGIGKDKLVDPVPLTKGSPVFGGAFHAYAPGAFDPLDAEPITIENFNGFSGLAYVGGEGLGRRVDRKTGDVKILDFMADMRLMSGVYRGVDNAIHQGAFAFV